MMPRKLGNKKNAWLVGLVSVTLAAGASLWESSGKVITVPYYDIVNVLTVCDGITGAQVVAGRIYTATECADFRDQHLKEHGAGVLACTTVPLSQNQYDAFTLFTYNVGVSAFCKSSLLKKLNAGDYVGACDALLRWDYAGGKRVAGLTNRRQWERKLCLKGST
jgi:lysozyme